MGGLETPQPHEGFVEAKAEVAQAIVEASLEAMVETVFEETMADAENGPKRPEDGPKSSRRLLRG